MEFGNNNFSHFHRIKSPSKNFKEDILATLNAHWVEARVADPSSPALEDTPGDKRKTSCGDQQFAGID